ncbi:acetyl-CoA C-acetyltransferase [Desulfotomaculum copahuensis]|uniref:Acetyl-CoA acetyltransferase n=1 Tax=Desulfotomaculum copahuensis TaxID=1838280 RepID=A0A1B7LEL4_9FIRM|nr:acetyl-CoA C-acetyltransferase [Desulfotomaculum copahuensis]OAT81729.1 acetyl-CoA acetyltransferase [Desulfotomaculum copahuensis]
MREVVVVGGVRTAIGVFGGSLKDVPVVGLGSLVIKEALKRSGLRPKSGEELLNFAPDALKGLPPAELEKEAADWDDALQPVQVDEVIMGHVLQAGCGQNTARQAAVHAGVPKESNAFTVNKVCASGLKAIALGAQAVMLGDAEVVVAGGMENMSQAPYALPRARWGYRMDVTAKGECLDLMVHDGLWEIFYGYHMGNTAENVAARYGISREEQDEIGLLSHQRARAAIADGLFKAEIVPVVIPRRKGDPVIFDTDERPMDTTREKMARLKPVFRKDGTVTAGNASGINDAAAAVVLMSREKAAQLGLKPWLTIRSWASGGVDPAYMGVGPIPAVRKALHKAGITAANLDVIELNEAFASQAIACMRELDLSMEKTNPLGSGISLGHPIGCTGARLMVTIMHEMKRQSLHYGLVTMCIGGGQGMAMVVENAG